MPGTGSAGFKGLAPTVAVVRKGEQPPLAVRLRSMLEGRRIDRVIVEAHMLEMHLDDGEVFRVANSGGWEES